jgi:uncharacterized membrane protein (DUF485 family)
MEKLKRIGLIAWFSLLYLGAVLLIGLVAGCTAAALMYFLGDVLLGIILGIVILVICVYFGYIYVEENYEKGE